MWALFLLFHQFSMKRSHEWIRLPELCENGIYLQIVCWKCSFLLLEFPVLNISVNRGLVLLRLLLNEPGNTKRRVNALPGSRLFRNSEEIFHIHQNAT